MCRAVGPSYAAATLSIMDSKRSGGQGFLRIAVACATAPEGSEPVTMITGISHKSALAAISGESLHRAVEEGECRPEFLADG
jgi:hypothetical protein